jgi:hypothetical protein
MSYIQGCDVCNQIKHTQEHPAGKLMPNPILTEPWKDLSANMIVGLTNSKGFNIILVVADRFSNGAHFIPCTNKLTCLGLAKLYLEHVWKLHGLLNSMILDKGPQFASNLMKDIIQSHLSTAYHPQTNGQTE